MGECSSLISSFETDRKAADDYRKPFEDVWIAGYKAFNSEYDATQTFRPNGSRVYYGLTRSKVMSSWARIMDIINNNKGQLPWSIEPTPDPTVPIKKVVDFIVDKLPDDMKAQVETQGVEALMDIVPKEIFDKAETALVLDANKKMRVKIEDAMVEDKTLVKVRAGLLERQITGTAVFKFGVCERRRTTWQTGTEGFEFDPQTEYDPTLKNPSIFNVWFDPSAQLLVDNGTLQSCEYVFERYPLTHLELLSLADKPGFDDCAVRALLKEGPNSTETQSDVQMRGMWGGSKAGKTSQYDVYERTGFVTVKQLREGGVDCGEDADDVDIMNMSVWYCGNHLLKVVELPDKVTRLPYMVVPLELAPGQLYGVGIPWKMRNGQAILNSAIRLFIDCKANASGPIAFVNADMWDASEASKDDLQPWGVVELAVPEGKSLRDFIMMERIPDVGDQLQGLMQLAKHQCDEESGTSSFSNASQSSALTKATGGTSSGMAMILSMADLLHKMAVQNVDDFLTTPLVTMYYNWFMQFSDDEDIKGDMQVTALGTIGVMKKEIMSQRLTQLITQTSNPVDSQIFNRQQLWLDVVDSYDLDPKKYMTQGMPGAPAAAPPPAPPGMPQTMVPPGPQQ